MTCRKWKRVVVVVVVGGLHCNPTLPSCSGPMLFVASAPAGSPGVCNARRPYEGIDCKQRWLDAILETQCNFSRASETITKNQRHFSAGTKGHIQYTVVVVFFPQPWSAVRGMKSHWDYLNISSGIFKGSLCFWYGLFINFQGGAGGNLKRRILHAATLFLLYVCFFPWQLNGASGICALFNIGIILSHKSYATSFPPASPSLPH